MHLDSAQGQITVYEPQVTTFDGNKLSARAAVSVAAAGSAQPMFGAIWIDSRASTDRVARTVQILDVTVTKSRFADTGGPDTQTLSAALAAALAQQPMTLSLDSLTAQLGLLDKEKQAVKDLSNSPPQIIFRDHASVLVQYDGQPRLSQVPNSPLVRADNTPFFVVLDPATKLYYLKGAGQWFAAPQPLGPFQTADSLPPEVAALADSSGYKDPQQSVSSTQAPGLEIVTATEPTELIWTDGAEEMGTIANTQLLYVTNTTSDVFVYIPTQAVFVVLSGRWYTASTRLGPWTYVDPNQLPPDFKQIPPNSEKADVLAHVPNTDQAKDAIADSYIPQTAAVDRTNFEQPAVTYDGDANFQPVTGVADCSYAVNTSASVCLVHGRYYCCSNAVWYEAGAPVGPWGLCQSVPQVIYTLPPSCPIYPVRYCYVYDVRPDVIYCGYLPGYVGCFHHAGIVVYGTGYHYEPWAGHVYIPRPCTYGFAAHYDETQNHWGFSVTLALGGATAWFGDRAGPTAHDVWFGHGGYRPVYRNEARSISFYHPRPVEQRAPIRADQWNVYERRKDIHPELVAPRREVPRETVARPGERPVETRNNVMVDNNGDVYRKTLDGWEGRDNNNWVLRRAEPAKPAVGARSEAPAQVEEHARPEPPARVAPTPEPAHEQPREQPHDQPRRGEGCSSG